MKILVIGSGGREHALYEALNRSESAEQVFVLPGNGGIPDSDRVRHISSPFADGFRPLREFVEKEQFDLVVIGPEQPLVDGVADALADTCLVFGPKKAAAHIEGSKSWARAFMDRHGIPSARYAEFSDFPSAAASLDTFGPPYVIKADGLAAGKGVTVTSDREQAVRALKAALVDGVFGSSGTKVLLEEFLPGREASVFAICDGEKALAFQAARDYKRAFDHNLGPNTGGMGAVTPVEYVTEEVMQQIQSEILDRAVQGFKKDGIPYRGLLYAGLMIHEGKTRVVEFNCRFGDPETQALLPLLEDDLAQLFFQAATGHLKESSLHFRKAVGMTVVLAAEGYPGDYRKGIDLTALEAPFLDGVQCYHAGTERNGSLKSTGGRIANITGTGASVEEVRNRIYSQLKGRSIAGTFFRSDIGL
jgi:phosphoribosylamine--glycine ligase